MKRLITLIGCAVLLAGCGTLNKEGPYRGDKALYDADLAISSSYEAIHSFVLWEYNSRAGLAATPNIRVAADAMRKQAPMWFSTALAMRDAYAAVPSDGNLAGLNQAISVLRAAVLESIKYMNTYGQAATP